MNSCQIDRLIKSDWFLSKFGNAELIETHISWVLLACDFVFKIKKPLSFSFLDFSTIGKRKYYCEQELLLNQRLAKNMYLKVVSINKLGENIFIDNDKGETIDYAVKMCRMDYHRQMDALLLKGEVEEEDIIRIVDKLALFHKNAIKIKKPINVGALQDDFADILKVEHFIKKEIGESADKILQESIECSAFILNKLKDRILERQALGFVVDGHGDLHSRNIFLLENEAVIFDCIEFNDHFRHVDVLDELAFFCMDLDFHGASKLESIFLEKYTIRNNCFLIEEDHLLYNYFKMYRANVRAKVAVINAMQLVGELGFDKQLTTVDKYLNLMAQYLSKIKCPA